jgi:hypothetical protein
VIVEDYAMLADLEALDAAWNMAVGEWGEWEWELLELDYWRNAIHCCVACPRC